MNEDVLAAIADGDEAEPLVGIEPFDRAGHLDRIREIGSAERSGRRGARRAAELTGHLEPRAAVARAKIVIVETAPARFAEILASAHCGCRLSRIGFVSKGLAGA